MLNRGKAIRLFKADWMEATSHVHPVVPAAIFLPVIGVCLWSVLSRGILARDLLLWSVLGLLSWTLTEYVMHRVVFHWKPIGPISERIHYIIHGIHHDDPNDATRLVMPPVLSVAMAPVYYLLWWLAAGTLFGTAGFIGFVIGYLGYDYTHFYVHHARPTTRFGKYIRRHHLYHHHGDDHANYGVSSPLWDVICGTLGKRS